MDRIRNRDAVKGLTSPEIRTDDTIPFVDDPVETPIRNNLLNPQNDKEFDPSDIEIKTEIPYVGDSVEVETEIVPVKPEKFKRNETKANVPPKKSPPGTPGVIHASDLGEVHKSPNNDTIVVNTPEGTLYITLEPDKLKSSPTSPSIESTNFSSPSTSKAYGASESSNLIANEIEIDARRAGLRRNSISMPTLHNLETEVLRQYLSNNPQEGIPEHHQSAGSGFSDGDEAQDNNEVLSDDSAAKAPLRSPRRKSAAPRRLRSEFSMDEEYSPTNSLSSVNSLASLLKEKLQSIPQKMRKKPTDYRIPAFVALMFTAIVFFISFAYCLYHQQASSKHYFQTVHFNEPKRLLRIYNKDDVEILRTSLAVGLASKVNSFPCLEEHKRADGSVCLEWLNKLRFYLKSIPNEQDNTTCFSIHWHALTHDVTPTDCFDWGDTKVHWYGGGQSYNLSWPLDSGFMDYTPFITGAMERSQFGNVLARYFINSKGAAIIVHEDTPLQVAVNKGGKQLCLRAKYDEFAYANQLTELPEMKYNICTGVDMKSLHSSIHSHRSSPLWDGLKPADMQTLESLLAEPVWEIAPRFKHELNTEVIEDYSEDIMKLGYLKQGHILINAHWQNEIGDLVVDKSRFVNLSEAVDKMRRRGFRVAFTVQPFISTESENFAECVQKRLLISERNSDRRIPALTRYKSLSSAGVLDITNNRSIPWILTKLQTLMDEYLVNSFFFDLGNAHDLPHYYRCEKSLTNPDQYKTIFVKTFEKSLSIIGVSSAVTLPKPPIFVSLPPFEPTWEALGKVIPTILTYGINGYPFIMPGAVGGDIFWPGSEQHLPSSKGILEPTNVTDDNGVELPEKELYIRWLQMATFLPVMKLTFMPSKYNDEKVLGIAKNLTLLRQKQVTPLLLKFKREALEEGLPLIRPLWLGGGGEAALLVQDEFLIGDELVVAPVLSPGLTAREVYLPAGLWLDGIDGSLRKGNRWMHEYRVPLDKVAYFIRKPDDMRFR